MLYNVKIVPIWLLHKGQEFSWSITGQPVCRLLRWNPNLEMYEYVYVDKPTHICYSMVKRTVVLPK